MTDEEQGRGLRAVKGEGKQDWGSGAACLICVQAAGFHLLIQVKGYQRFWEHFELLSN